MATVASTSSSTISLPGVFSGIDTETIVMQLMAAESRPLAALQTQKTTWQAKQAAVLDVETKLASLKSLLADLRNIGRLNAVTATSSMQDVVTVAAQPGSGEGSHTVEVQQLAKAHRMVHATGLDSLTTQVGQGQFVYSFNGTTRTIQTTAATTLADLRDLINRDAGNPGVTATVMQYNSKYYLVLAGNRSGTDCTISIDTEQTTLADFDEADEFVTTQAAQNARFRVDGFPVNTEEYIERSTNSVSDVLDGVTLNLVSAGSSTVTVSRNTQAVTDKLNSLVASYNDLATAVRGYTGYDAAAKKAGVLQGDGVVNNILSQVRSLLTRRVGGFTGAGGQLSLPSDIGMGVDKDGTMSLDAEKFQTALSDHYEDVLALIGASGTGTTSDSRVQFTSADSSTTPGTYRVRVSFADGAIASAEIQTDGETAWRAMTVEGAEIVGQSGNPECWLRLNVPYDEQMANPLEFSVSVQKGFAGALDDRVKDILDKVSGPVANKKTNCQRAIDELDRKMRTMNDRLDAKEKRLRAQFNRMEAMLAMLDLQRGAVDTLAKTVEANTKASE